MAENRKSHAATEEAIIGKRSGAVTLWAALRTEQRRSVERATMGFGRCGWRDEAAEQPREYRRR